MIMMNIGWIMCLIHGYTNKQNNKNHSKYRERKNKVGQIPKSNGKIPSTTKPITDQSNSI